ncbi:MAG: acetyltransferase [Vicinamibacterales bacterium]
MSVHPEAAPVRVVIVGAGGQGQVVADILHAAGPAGGLRAIGFVDDAPERVGASVLGLPVHGGIDVLATLPHDAVVVAIGDNAVRARISLSLESLGERLVSVRHPFSSVAASAQIGVGCMISAGAVITPSVRLGRGVLVNTNASIDHDTLVEDFAHVACGAVVGGSAFIGARSLVGIGAAVMSGRRVGADAVVGAGALVHRDLPDGVVAFGVPARPRAGW